MLCPKCHEGKIVKVIVKITGEVANLCESCETIWLQADGLTADSGHTFRILTQGNAIEYILSEAQDEDQEHRPVKYPTLR